MEQLGTSSCLYNHDGFNWPTEMEKEKLFAFILSSSGAAVSAVDVIGQALRRVHQTRSLHSLTKLLKSLLVV